MSNYPNMSYCMCENTLSAMLQLKDAINDSEGFNEFMETLSKTELRAFERLVDIARDFAEEFDSREEY